MENKIWNAAELYAYLDGELLPAQEEALKAELEINQSLQAQLAQQRQTVELLQILPLQETPRNYLLTPSLVRVAEPRPKLRRRRFTLWGLRLATTFSALVFVVALGLQFAPLDAIPQPLAQAPAMIEKGVAGDMEEVVTVEKVVEIEKVVEQETYTESRELPAVEVAAEEEPAVMDSAPPPTATASTKNVGGGEDFETLQNLEAGEAYTAEWGLCSTEEGDAECGGTSEVVEETLAAAPSAAVTTEPTSIPTPDEEYPDQVTGATWWLVGALGLMTLVFAAVTWRVARRS
ncbi:MAG: hypothetical protein K8R89_07925 [Anaerolineae bacterium]|nr:hypothetical protein [Anaerolineae bacterium]